LQPALIAVSLAMLISGCADFSAAVTNTIDDMGLTPDYAKGKKEALQQRKLETPSVTVAENVPEGKLVEHYENGNKKFETTVKNRCFDDYIDVYYPNGQLRAHTPLVNCKANGVSQGYTQDGKLRTEITYKDGMADGEAKGYDASGKVVRTFSYKDGFPVSKS
jgi:antitoxin component YwqK of YwqJK toxin-antitoxin module